jgi:gliding motility-associated-like protein
MNFKTEISGIMKRQVLILFLLLLFSKSFGQGTETNYLGTLIAQGPVNNIPIASEGPFPIGFNFTYYGNTYSQFYINGNGLVMFTAPAGNYNTEASIPTAAAPNNFIAAFWDDLMIDGTGKILYTTIGAAPTRRLIVQFNNMVFNGAPTFMGSFAIILNETSNIIQVQYHLIVNNSSPKAHGSSAAIGIENSDGSAGIQYLFDTAGDITSGKAISFTPSGVTYNMNSDAVYEGVYLTTNTTLPEPAIPQLLSPPQNSTIGSAARFEWSDAGNAASYSLLIGLSSDLGDAVLYNAGTNLYYDITGLTLDTTYYWGVFANNSTGTTWCQINKFKTASNPPLAAVPEVLWVEINQDIAITLDYTGGDASAKTEIITSLPAQGALYQYNAGVRGTQITSVPTTVTDPSGYVIYSASGSSGNGSGNFSFKVHDDTGDSPTAQITINVSPADMPDLQSTGKAATYVEMQFDHIMADPSGKESQFTITQNSTPITISSLALKAGDPYTIVATLGSTIALSDVITVSYTAGTIASSAGGLLASFTSQTVSLYAQTINFPANLSKKYGDAPFALTATASSGLTTFTYSSSNLGVATISGSTLTIHTVGNSDITARQAGNATWAPANYVKTLTVSKADQTITFSVIPSKTYGDADFSLTPTSSSALSVSLSSGNTAVATVTGNVVHIVGAGSAVITASQPGNAYYNAAPDVPQTLTVNKANQSVTFNPLAAKTYGDADFTLTGTSSSGLSVAYASNNTSVATVTGNTVHIVAAGTAVITASQAGNTNYNAAADVPQTLTVNKADQTITFTALADKAYGDADFTLTATSTSGLTVSFAGNNPSVATVTGTTVHVVAPGSVVITASQAGDANYNAAADVPQTLTVNKANQTISFSALSPKVYGDPDFTLSASASSGLSVSFTVDNPSVATVTGNTVHIVAPGTVIITASQSGDANFNAAPDVPQTLIVSKADQTISFSALPSKTFGDADFSLSATSSSGLSVSFASSNPLVATVTGTTVHLVAPGSCTITASQAGDANYNAAADMPQTLTVNKIDQTITFGAIPAKTYGDADFSISATSSSGLSVSFSSGNPAVATVAGNLVHIVGAGTSIITASQSGDANYNAALDVPQTLTVNKANQTITFGSLPEKNYDDADFTISATSSSGLAVSFSSGNTSVATVTGTTVHIVAGGTAVITASQSGNTNFNAATDIPQTLTVHKLLQTISFTDYPEKLLMTDSHALAATSSASLPVQFESLNTSIATVSGASVTGVAAGTVQIRAFNNGDVNYDPAEATVTIEVYSTHKDIMYLFTPNNDGINDLWELPDLATWGKCDVRVFNRWGKLVFASPDYHNEWDGTSDSGPVPEGAYYFIIKTENNGIVKGTVNLVR